MNGGKSEYFIKFVFCTYHKPKHKIKKNYVCVLFMYKRIFFAEEMSL